MKLVKTAIKCNEDCFDSAIIFMMSVSRHFDMRSNIFADLFRLLQDIAGAKFIIELMTSIYAVTCMEGGG
jgi:hypothetical protein